MKKPLALCCLFAVLFIQNINSQNLGDLYTERNAGFTMSMPKGWQAMDASQKYLVVIGQTEDGFTPNITFVDEEYSGSISEYIDAAISILGMVYADFRVLNRANFTTESGLQGGYITLQGRLNDISVRQRLYVFPNRRRTEVMVITGTSPLYGEKYDAIFNESVRTFNWIR
jgi:hypothetical protein